MLDRGIDRPALRSSQLQAPNAQHGPRLLGGAPRRRSGADSGNPALKRAIEQLEPLLHESQPVGGAARAVDARGRRARVRRVYGGDWRAPPQPAPPRGRAGLRRGPFGSIPSSGPNNHPGNRPQRGRTTSCTSLPVPRGLPPDHSSRGPKLLRADRKRSRRPMVGEPETAPSRLGLSARIRTPRRPPRRPSRPQRRRRYMSS